MHTSNDTPVFLLEVTPASACKYKGDIEFLGYG